METYKDLLDRKPKETPAYITIDGVEARISYELEECGIISASYSEIYKPDNLSWLQERERVMLYGDRSYYNNTQRVVSKIDCKWMADDKPVSIELEYHGESRRNALKQMETIVKAYRAAIDAIGNADNPDFEAELDAAVTEHVTGGEAE